MWTLEVGDGASAATPGRNLGLTQARSSLLTRRVNGHHFAQFTLSGAVHKGSLVQDLAAEERSAIELRKSDLWMWRKGVLLFRGRIVTQEVLVDATTWTTTFHAVDYRGLLAIAARLEGTIPTWTNTSHKTIIWQLVQHRQAQTGGDWGIVDGTHSGSAQNRDQTDLTAGKPVAEAIDAIANLSNGFDWEISPTLELNSWSPRRTRDQGVQLAYGSEIVSYRGSTAEWANAATFTGAAATTAGVALSPVTVADGAVGSDDRGRWSAFGSSPNMKRSSSITAAANGLLASKLTEKVAWSIELASGMWDQLHNADEGVAACDLGELTNLVLGPDDVDTTSRVIEQQITPGDNGPGSEVVRMELLEES